MVRTQFLVKAVRVELTSENNSVRLSPSAADDLDLGLPIVRQQTRGRPIPLFSQVPGTPCGFSCILDALALTCRRIRQNARCRLSCECEVVVSVVVSFENVDIFNAGLSDCGSLTRLHYPRRNLYAPEKKPAVRACLWMSPPTAARSLAGYIVAYGGGRSN